MCCFAVSCASSSASSKPKRVTRRAASFRSRGMDITGVFRGIILEVSRRPAIMLPQASRLMGLSTTGLFSLIGERTLNRGWPMETKKTIRRL